MDELDQARRIERTFEPGRSARWRDDEMRRWRAAVAVLAMPDAERRR